MKPRLIHAICISLILAVFAFSTWMYPQLPDMVPSHWNSAGEIDGYMAKPWGVYLLPLITLVIYLMFFLLPVISPRGFRMEKFNNTVRLFQLAMVLFMGGISVTTLLAGRGDEIPVSNIVMSGVGLLFLVLGNYMGKLQKNFFIGIRTPWTLASDEVWGRTHRLGGWTFTAAGLFMVLGSFLGMGPRVLIWVTAAAVLAPVLYSFLLYRRIEGLGPDNEDA
jgi:uncharacterized membrane protein